MEDCIFCKIVKKEVPSNIVFENDQFMAFLDVRPLAPGHVLVIPKQHYRWVWDVPNLGEYFEIVGKIASAQRKAFQDDQIICKIVGEEVPHAHIWIYPSDKAKGDKKNLEKNRDMIVDEMSN